LTAAADRLARMATDAIEPSGHPEYEPPRAEYLVSDDPLETGAVIGVGYFGGHEVERPSPIRLPY
jgi:hypothetical protein